MGFSNKSIFAPEFSRSGVVQSSDLVPGCLRELWELRWESFKRSFGVTWRIAELSGPRGEVIDFVELRAICQYSVSWMIKQQAQSQRNVIKAHIRGILG
jgi:hypothetical protein